MLGTWQSWVLLNPVAPILESLRSAIVLGTTPDLPWLLYSAVVSIVVFVSGWQLFHHLEPTFADNV